MDEYREIEIWQEEAEAFEVMLTEEQKGHFRMLLDMIRSEEERKERQSYMIGFRDAVHML